MTWTNTPPDLFDANGNLDVKKLNNYLWKMNDLLTLCFGNIGTDNLDSNLHKKLNDLFNKE